MKVTEEKSKGLNKKYSVTIEAADFAAAVEKKLAEVIKDVKMPGFRAGHAPKAMIEKKYRPSVLGEVLDDMVRDAVNTVITQNYLRPSVYPDIKLDKFEDGKDIEFTMETEILPEIKLGDFSKISLKKYIAKVPAEDVTRAVQQIAASRRNTSKVEEDRAAQKGDVVVIETVNVKTTFPENYHAKDLAGKEALFVTTIKELRSYTPVEINDEFAKSVGAKDLADLKSNIENRIAQDYENVSHLKLKRELLDALDKEYKFEIPQKLVDAEYEAIEKQYQNHH